MPCLSRHSRLDPDDLAGVLRQRTGLVAESQPIEIEPAGIEPNDRGDGRPVRRHVSWTATGGPVRDYRRTVEIEPLTDGLALVTQVVEYRMDIPLLVWLVALPTRRRLGSMGPQTSPPWWGPPDVLDRAAWAAVAALVALTATIGYLSTLLTQTITYSALEYRAGTTAQGVALAVVRGDVIISIALVGLADRRGRRVVVLGGAAAGCALTAVGALAPSLAWLAASQVLARGFVTAASIAATVLVAEAMPSGARAWAVGIIAMSTAVGAGVCVVSLPIAGIGLRSWRLLYVGALAWLLLVAISSRHLEESSRYIARDAERRDGRRPPRPRLRDLWGRRLALLAGAFLLLQVFVTPATQFRNEYLRHERGFSPSRISLYTVLTVLPGALGIVVGGRLADTRGRRGVAIVAVLGAAAGGVAAYWLAGWPMWLASAAASLTGAAVIPALSVYGPELFDTDQRGAANGVLTAAGRIGSVIGLLAAGALAQRLGHFGPAFALLGGGPLVLAVLIAVAFPETAHRSLEELNPLDPTDAELGGI